MVTLSGLTLKLKKIPTGIGSIQLVSETTGYALLVLTT